MKKQLVIAASALIGLAAPLPALATSAPAPAQAETDALVAPVPPAPPPAAAAAPIPQAVPAPAPVPAIPLAKKVELLDGSWALVDGDTVKISTDNGTSWAPAPNQTWIARDGSKLTTKSGKILK